MTCILKDMRQGEGSDGRGIRAKVGNKGQEISEVWGMTFWRPVVGGILENMAHTFWRTCISLDRGRRNVKRKSNVYRTTCRKARFVSEETLLQGS